MLRRFRHQYRGTRVLTLLRRPTLFIYKNINNHYSADLHNIYIGVNILAIRDKYWYVYYTDTVNASMTVSEVCELKHKTN